MCGIAGILAFTEEGKKQLDKIDDAVSSLRHRGPDGNGVFRHDTVALGHTRLAIIDTSDAAAQPFTSSDGRYTIVFNGEIFNYRELRSALEQEGHSFRTHSDTEVLVTLYAKEGKDCLGQLNGFFAFAVYDQHEGTLFLARDRFGEKPLYIGAKAAQTNGQDASPGFIAFASEPKALYALGIPVEFDRSELRAYMHLNYLPASATFNSHIRKLNAGSQLTYRSDGTIEPGDPTWYTVHARANGKPAPAYETARAEVRRLLELSVQRRLISDVPIGSFLSGGIDSSIVSALAAQQKAQPETFSIGYADEKYFDETEYAQLVARHIGSKHHVFSLTNNDLLASLHTYLDNLDEPFADSSALAVNILAHETKKYVTVALSGDGADELFAGYNKHAAEYFARKKGLLQSFIKTGKSLWNVLPASRQSGFGNRVRQLRKLAHGLSLDDRQRYFQWAGYATPQELRSLLGEHNLSSGDAVVEHMHTSSRDFNDVLVADFRMVLQSDMLVKVDRMSMLNGLEVRSPFLDHELVEYVMSLPSEYKIDRNGRKKILKDAGRDLLPPEIFTRRKHGFEVPLLKWFRNDLRGLIDELLGEKFLKEQDLFNPEAVKEIRKQLHSGDPSDAAARVWGLIVFQSWWKKYVG